MTGQAKKETIKVTFFKFCVVLLFLPPVGLEAQGRTLWEAPKNVFFLCFPWKIANLEAGGQRECPLGG